MDGGEGLSLASSLSPKLELQLKWKAAKGFLDVAVRRTDPGHLACEVSTLPLSYILAHFIYFLNERGSRVAQAHLELPV